MSSVEKAYQTQMDNIQKKTGKNMEELAAIIHQSGLTKHSELRTMLMQTLNLGYGDASMLIHHTLKTDGETAAKERSLTTGEVLDEIYSGPKAALRPIHDALMEHIELFGEFEIAPKKGYVSLRRKRQFAMIGPATNTRVEVGLNHKTLPAHERLIAQKAGSMCNFVVKLTDAAEVDDDLIGWLRQAYETTA